MLSVDELVREISDKSGKTEEELRQLIKEKQVELSDLVSEEGAAYIVGRELGVELVKETKRELKINNIVPDMRNVDLVARVSGVFDKREFERNGKKGVVSSILLADETGTVRLPLWNDEVKLLESLDLKRNDVVEVTGAWAKKDTYKDGIELRLGKRGNIKRIEEGDAPDTLEGVAPQSQEKGPAPQQAAERYDIKSLSPGFNAIVKGCIVQAYRKRPYFEACPNCGGRLEEKGDGMACKEHGLVQPAPILLLTGVIDDGTGNVRCVFFREQAEKIFGRKPEEVKQAFEAEGIETFWSKFDSVGKEIMIEGRVKANELNKELELIANSVSEVNVKDECQRLMKELEK